MMTQEPSTLNKQQEHHRLRVRFALQLHFMIAHSRQAEMEVLHRHSALIITMQISTRH